MDINATLIGQMITFAIFVGFTMKFVWPPLRKAMEERRIKISDGLASADRAQKELELARRQSNDIINQAKEQSNSIIESANMRAIKIDEEAKETARKDAEMIRRHAKDEIANEREILKQALRREVIDIAIAGAEKIIKAEINPAKHSNLLEEISSKL